MRILLAVEDDDSGKAIAEFVMKNLVMTNEIMVLHVIRPITSYVSLSVVPELIDEIRREERQAGAAIVRRVALILRDYSHAADIRETVVDGNPPQAIVHVATEWKADLLVVWSHGRQGLAKLLSGSISTQTAEISKCSILIVHSELPAAQVQPDSAAVHL